MAEGVHCYVTELFDQEEGKINQFAKFDAENIIGRHHMTKIWRYLYLNNSLNDIIWNLVVNFHETECYQTVVGFPQTWTTAIQYIAVIINQLFTAKINVKLATNISRHEDIDPHGQQMTKQVEETKGKLMYQIIQATIVLLEACEVHISDLS